MVEGRHRRYYDLTEAGVSALTKQTEQLRANTWQATAGLKKRAAPGQLGAIQGRLA